MFHEIFFDKKYIRLANDAIYDLGAEENNIHHYVALNFFSLFFSFLYDKRVHVYILKEIFLLPQFDN